MCVRRAFDRPRLGSLPATLFPAGKELIQPDEMPMPARQAPGTLEVFAQISQAHFQDRGRPPPELPALVLTGVFGKGSLHMGGTWANRPSVQFSTPVQVPQGAG